MAIAIEIFSVPGDKVVLVLEDGATLSVDPSSKICFSGYDVSHIDPQCNGPDLVVVLANQQQLRLTGFLDLEQGGIPGGILAVDGELVASVSDLVEVPPEDCALADDPITDEGAASRVRHGEDQAARSDSLYLDDVMSNGSKDIEFGVRDIPHVAKAIRSLTWSPDSGAVVDSASALDPGTDPVTNA